MSIFNKLAKANKNGLADKKRLIIGQYIKASKEVEKYEGDKNSIEYKRALESAKDIYEKIFNLTPELKEFYNSNSDELTFSEKHLLGSDRDDRTDIKDLSTVVERYLINSSPKEETAVDLSGIVKTMKVKVPKYVDGDIQIAEDEDGNVIPIFEDMEIYTLGSTQEEINNSLKKLVSGIEEKFNRQLEAKLEEISDSPASNLNTDDIQEELVKKSLEIVKQGLSPEIKRFIASGEGQRTIKSSLALDRLSDITQKYIESIRDANIQNGQPMTPLGAFLTAEIVNKKGEKVYGLTELANKMYDLVKEGVNKNPYLLDSYTGNNEIDLKFQDILHNTTDVALATLKVENMDYNFPATIMDKPTFVEPETSRFAENMQKVLDNTFGNPTGNPYEPLGYQEPLPPKQEPQALPSQDNQVDNRVAETINNTTSQYVNSNAIPKGVITINPGDLTF